MNRPTQTVRAVSYTHLDVYKRQAVGQADDRTGKEGVACAGGVDDVHLLGGYDAALAAARHQPLRSLLGGVVSSEPPSSLCTRARDFLVDREIRAKTTPCPRRIRATGLLDGLCCGV